MIYRLALDQVECISYFYVAIVNTILRHCHFLLAWQQKGPADLTTFSSLLVSRALLHDFFIVYHITGMVPYSLASSKVEVVNIVVFVLTEIQVHAFTVLPAKSDNDVMFCLLSYHGLGKCWPLGFRLWCLTVSLSLSDWYPGSGVVLDCIDSWSLHPYLLL